MHRCLSSCACTGVRAQVCVHRCVCKVCVHRCVCTGVCAQVCVLHAYVFALTCSHVCACVPCKQTCRERRQVGPHSELDSGPSAGLRSPRPFRSQFCLFGNRDSQTQNPLVSSDQNCNIPSCWQCIARSAPVSCVRWAVWPEVAHKGLDFLLL